MSNTDDKMCLVKNIVNGIVELEYYENGIVLKTEKVKYQDFIDNLMKQNGLTKETVSENK